MKRGNYLDFWGKNPSHFRQDLKRVPVMIGYLGFKLDPDLARNIKAAAPVSSLSLCHAVSDDELRRLYGLSGPCDLILQDIENISADALDEFRWRTPHVHVYRSQEGQLHLLDD